MLEGLSFQPRSPNVGEQRNKLNDSLETSPVGRWEDPA